MRRGRRTISARATIISKGLCGTQEAEPGCERVLVERRDAIREDEREQGRASQIETNGDLYASRRIPHFYYRLISSPSRGHVLLLLLRGYDPSPLSSPLLQKSPSRSAPTETDVACHGGQMVRAARKRVQERG